MRRSSPAARIICLALLSVAVPLSTGPTGSFLFPPEQRPPAPFRAGRTIRLDIEFDQHFRRLHGHGAADLLDEAVLILSREWLRYRPESFELGEVRHRNSGESLDASYVLANFLLRTTEKPDTIHVNVVGRQLETYRDSVLRVGGLAYRRSDALVISAPEGVTGELLGYYLFHEIGHCWEAYDLPFEGGDSTFGSKRVATFFVDPGNEEILHESAGPAPRATPNLAPAVIEARLERVAQAVRGTMTRRLLADLVLHEASAANPAYVRKKSALLRIAHQEREAVEGMLAGLEQRRAAATRDAEIAREISERYWTAMAAMEDRDFMTAECEIEAIRSINFDSPELRELTSAVSRKIRRRR